MNKVKMFFVAAAMLLTTAGVFAGKAKFAVTGVYLVNGSNVRTITTGNIAFFQTNQTGSATAATLQDQAGNTYTLSTNVSGTYVPVYTTF